MTKTSPSVWKKIANAFGAIAYLLIAVQWLWLVATMVMPLVSTSPFREYALPQESHQAVNTLTLNMTMPPWAQAVVVALAVIFAIGVTVYAIYMMPVAISRASQATVKKAATVTVNHQTRHQKIKPQQKQRLQLRYLWVIKLLAILLPPSLSLLPTHYSLNLDHAVAIVTALFLASLSLGGLGLQVLVAYAAKVPVKELR